MKTWVLVGVLAASVAVVVWMVRLSVDTYRDIRRQESPAAGLREMNKSRLGGLLVVVPAILLGLSPLPEWVTMAYLIVAVVVLGLMVLRQHRDPRRRS